MSSEFSPSTKVQSEKVQRLHKKLFAIVSNTKFFVRLINISRIENWLDKSDLFNT